MAINYTYSDLSPLLEQARQNNNTYNLQYGGLNRNKVSVSKEPHEWDKTIPERADSLPSIIRGISREGRKIKQAENAVNNMISQNQELFNQYKNETDRRNNILNRMDFIKNYLTNRVNESPKNRLLTKNSIPGYLNEYKILRGEADKFIGFINNNK